ncbi:MAG: hypothetical protein V1917_01445 [Candidatus Gottesmanbacteria bacterium]
MLFQSKEHGRMGPGEDLIPIWSRLQLDIEKRGWKSYIETLFDRADTIAKENCPSDPRESKLIQIEDMKNFYRPTLTYEMVQMIPSALLKHLTDPESPLEPIYIGATFTFTYGMSKGHTMRIAGHEETYNGPVPDTFAFPENGGNQTVHDAIILAMLRPRDFTQRQEPPKLLNS